MTQKSSFFSIFPYILMGTGVAFMTETFVELIGGMLLGIGIAIIHVGLEDNER